MLLNFVKHPDGYVVVASNAGAASPPAWWRNLGSDPDATIVHDGVHVAVRASALEDPERDRAWSSFVAANPDYARYAAEAGREIPVVLLRRVTG